MKSKFKLTWVLIVLLSALTWGCGSNRDAGDSIVGGEDTIESAEALGITNCLTCHNTATKAGDGWINSRHANGLTNVEKEALNYQTINGTPRPSHSDDPSPAYSLSGTCTPCHDQLGDGMLIGSAITGESDRPVVGCESCHGGGQYHNGIGPIPYPSLESNQCGQCHGIASELFHSGSGSGNNVRRNITDSHIDDPATRYESPQVALNLIEGYVITTTGVGGCKDCHVAHVFDLTINNQWASSPHGGDIKGQKDDALEAGRNAGDSSSELLTRVKAAGVNSSTGDGWVHYDWDDSAGNGPGGRDRSSCQRCHTSTGLVNFMVDTASYDAANNDFSHLDGWAANKWSGQNEMLYCWGCHSNVQTGALRDDPNGITLDFVNEDPSGPSGAVEFVTLPDKGKSDICGACHSGRGNNTSIRTGNRSSRFAGHHAPTAGSLYAEDVRTGFEYENPPGTPLDYTPLSYFAHDEIDSALGPCVACHMANSADHNFEAVSSGSIVNLPGCNTASCHNGTMSDTVLNGFRTDFQAARTVLEDWVNNVTTNTYNADLTQKGDDTSTGYSNVEINGYGAFQNWKYMTEEEGIFVHNSRYGKRLIFDSIDWLDNGVLNGNISSSAADAWIGTSRP